MFTGYISYPLLYQYLNKHLGTTTFVLSINSYKHEAISVVKQSNALDYQMIEFPHD